MKQAKKPRGRTASSSNSPNKSAPTTTEPQAVAAEAPVSAPILETTPAHEVKTTATASSDVHQRAGARSIVVSEDDADDGQAVFLTGGGKPLPPPPPRGHPLSLRLSHQLYCKLQRMAQDEGLDLETLSQELLTEGVTLRAWEIIERKSAMRGGFAPSGAPGRGYNNANSSHGNQQSNGNRPGGHRSHGQNNYGASQHAYSQGGYGQGSGRRPGPGTANNAWMEDKAAFLEYVRNQEKRRR